MKVKILGTRGEIEESLPKHSKHSGVLVDGKLLFDLGEKEFLKYHPKHIFITHLHPDHAYFVRWGKEEKPSVSIPIYCPELPEKKFLRDSVRVLTTEIELDSYKIICIPTHHSKKVKSQAYLIKSEQHSVLYTGDLIWINKEYQDLFNRVDVIITEGSFIRKGGMVRKDKETGQLYGHTGIPNLIDLFKSYTKKIVFMHFGAWFYKDIDAARKVIEALGKEKGIQTFAAYDGMEIDL